jgi:hypothetical protein
MWLLKKMKVMMIIVEMQMNKQLIFEHYDGPLHLQYLLKLAKSSRILDIDRAVEVYCDCSDNGDPCEDHEYRISNDWVIDDCLKAFKFLIDEAYLPYCSNITNRGLKYLKWVKVITLSSSNITDKGLSYLSQIEDLRLSDCHNVTINGIRRLRKLKKLSIVNCKGIDGHQLAQYMKDNGIMEGGCEDSD